MKKIIAYWIFLLAILGHQITNAQDVGININTANPSIPLGTSTYVEVSICNLDPNPIDAAANKLRPLLSVSPNVTITGVTNADGTPLTGWNILSLTTGNANSVRLQNTAPIPNGDCSVFHVIIQGTVVSGNQVFSGTLNFNGPQTPGNNPANDNSSTGVAVTPAVATPPIATDNTVTTNHDTPVTITVLNNDTPGTPTGPAIDVTTVLLIDPADGTKKTTVTIPGEGTYTVNTTTGEVIFTPAPGVNGITSTIKYTVKDTSGAESNEANITIDIPLPVTLVSFDVTSEGKVAKLAWATTMETNSDYFEIQHSVTGKEWAVVGRVSSHGESTSLKKYTFSHATPVNGENLYRLKMVDKDQTFAHSRIRSVKFEGITDADLSVYPNPVYDKLNIRDISGVAQINIYDLKGVSLYQSVAPKSGEINVGNLPGGMYIVKTKLANGTVVSQKIVVSK